MSRSLHIVLWKGTNVTSNVRSLWHSSASLIALGMFQRQATPFKCFSILLPKQVITVFLSTMLLPNHLNGVRGFRGWLVAFPFIPYQLLLSSCDYFGGSYYPLEASALHSCCSVEYCSGLQSLLLPLLGKMTPPHMQDNLLCSLQGTPRPRLVAGMVICCTQCVLRREKHHFPLGRWEEAQPPSSPEQVKSSEKGMCIARWAQLSSQDW